MQKLGIPRSTFDNIPDELGGNPFSGARYTHPQLMPNIRMGEVLHIFGKERERELSAHWLLGVLKDLFPKSNKARGPAGVVNDQAGNSLAPMMGAKMEAETNIFSDDEHFAKKQAQG